MKDLDYTIWFVPYDSGFYPYDNAVEHWDYMWSLTTKTAKNRIGTQGTEMYAPIFNSVGGDQKPTFHLLKMKPPIVSEPVRKRDIVEIFGRDGDIDLYENLLQKPIFERRTIEEQFMLLGQNAESGNYYVGSDREWAALISQLKNFFNSHMGQMRIVLSHDPGFYWLGRVTAAVDDIGGYRAVIRITADVEPYKYERYASNEAWIWDDFSFIDGIIREYGNITVDNSHETVDSELNTHYCNVLEVPVRLRDVVPTFLASGTGISLGDVQVSDDLLTWYDVPIIKYGNPTLNGTEHQIQLEGARNPILVATTSYLYFRNNSYLSVTPQTGDNPKEKNWFERSGTSPNYVYTPTTDTTVDSGKTYYKPKTRKVSVSMRGATL